MLCITKKFYLNVKFTHNIAYVLKFFYSSFVLQLQASIPFSRLDHSPPLHMTSPMHTVSDSQLICYLHHDFSLFLSLRRTPHISFTVAISLQNYHRIFPGTVLYCHVEHLALHSSCKQPLSAFEVTCFNTATYHI